MTGAHLGELAAALADGNLTDGSRERALRHIASCERCRVDVEAQRGARSRIADLPTPEPAAALRGRLLAIPADELEANNHGTGRGPGGWGAPSFAHPRQPLGAPHDHGRLRRGGRRRPHGRAAAVVVGAAASVVGVLGGAVALGGTDAGHGNVVDPATEHYAVEHATTAGEVPFTAGMVGVAYTYAGTAAIPVQTPRP